MRSQNLPRGQVVLASYRKGSYGRLDRLVDSIGSIGLIHPLILAPNRTLLHGERRFAALDKMGKSEVPVVYVSDMQEYTILLKEQHDDRISSLSHRPSELAAFMDTAIVSGLSVPTTDNNREVSVLALVADALGITRKTVSALLTIHRTAYKGLDAEDRQLGREMLDALDNQVGIAPCWEHVNTILGKKYNMRISYRYIELLTKDVGRTPPGEKVSAGGQRHTLVQATSALDAVKNALQGLGKLHEAIGKDERIEYARRLREARVAISGTITALEGHKK